MFRWDDEKSEWLKRHRGTSLKQIAEMIAEDGYLGIENHPTRINQKLFVIRLDGYVWAVPYVVEADEETVFLKTAYPSRKLNQQYGGFSYD